VDVNFLREDQELAKEMNGSGEGVATSKSDVRSLDFAKVCPLRSPREKKESNQTGGRGQLTKKKTPALQNGEIRKGGKRSGRFAGLVTQ